MGWVEFYSNGGVSRLLSSPTPTGQAEAWSVFGFEFTTFDRFLDCG